jgi:hypothetical protein
MRPLAFRRASPFFAAISLGVALSGIASAKSFFAALINAKR